MREVSKQVNMRKCNAWAYLKRDIHQRATHFTRCCWTS